MDTDGAFLDGNLVGGEGHTAPLEGDGIPDENQSHFCLSCEEPLVDLYCGNCGQKNDNYRRSLFSLAKEAFISLTAVENRIWRTWAALLFKPGKVAREYANGRRMHWSSPIRVYIFMSILLFGFMEITGTYFFAVEVNPVPNEGVTKPAIEYTADDISLDWSLHWFPTATQVKNWNADVNFSLIREKLLSDDDGGMLNAIFGGEYDLSITTPAAALNALKAIEDESDNLTASEREDAIKVLQELSVNLRAGAQGAAAIGLDSAADEIEKAIEEQKELLKEQREDEALHPDVSSEDTDKAQEKQNTITVNGETVDASAANRLLIDFLRNPAVGNNILNKWLPRIIFLMMPLTMIIAALFIRGRGPRRWFGKHKGQRTGHEALLYDHLVHAAYIHAVTYMLVFVGILVARASSGGWIAQVIFIALLIYLPLSLRGMFRRGWVKTVWTSYGVAFLYVLIISVLLTLAVGSELQEQVNEREAIMAFETS